MWITVHAKTIQHMLPDQKVLKDQIQHIRIQQETNNHCVRSYGAFRGAPNKNHSLAIQSCKKEKPVMLHLGDASFSPTCALIAGSFFQSLRWGLSSRDALASLPQTEE